LLLIDFSYLVFCSFLFMVLAVCHTTYLTNEDDDEANLNGINKLAG